MKLQCPQCNASLTVDDAAAGKTGKCPKCGVPIKVPLPEAKPEPTAEPEPQPESEHPWGGRATKRQKEYARDLGIEFQPDISKGHLSRLISEAVEHEQEERFARLDELGNRESEAYEKLRAEALAEIDEEDCRLSVATPEQIVEAFEERDEIAILVTHPYIEVGEEPLGRIEMHCSDNVEAYEALAILSIIVDKWKAEHGL
jgi:predicted Zn finger-like uncharacterized protein